MGATEACSLSANRGPFRSVIPRNKRGRKRKQKNSCNASQRGSEDVNDGVSDGRAPAPQTSDDEAWSGTASGSRN